MIDLPWMPDSLPYFLDWVYMNCYEQVDFNTWKRWYTDEALADDDTNIDTKTYTLEDLYEMCRKDYAYWQSVNNQT